MIRVPRVESIGLLLLDNEGRLYGLRELKPKPAVGKVLGIKDYSFPWETIEEGENYMAAFIRLIQEEIDKTLRIVMSMPLPVADVWVYDTLAHIYMARFISGPEKMRGSDAGIEVEPLGFITRATLLSRSRDGVRDVLDALDRLSEVRLVA